MNEPVFVGRQERPGVLRQQGRYARRRPGVDPQGRGHLPGPDAGPADRGSRGRTRRLPVGVLPDGRRRRTRSTLTGTIEGQAIDELFTSSPTGFNEVQALSGGQFPVQFPAQADIVADAQAGKDAASQVTIAIGLGCRRAVGRARRDRARPGGSATDRLTRMTRRLAASVAAWAVALAGLTLFGPARRPPLATPSSSPAFRPRARSSPIRRPSSGSSSPSRSSGLLEARPPRSRPARRSLAGRSARRTRPTRTRLSRRSARLRGRHLHRRLAGAVRGRRSHDVGLLHVRRRQRRGADRRRLDRRRGIHPRRPRRGDGVPRDGVPDRRRPGPPACARPAGQSAGSCFAIHDRLVLATADRHRARPGAIGAAGLIVLGALGTGLDPVTYVDGQPDRPAAARPDRHCVRRRRARSSRSPPGDPGRRSSSARSPGSAGLVLVAVERPCRGLRLAGTGCRHPGPSGRRPVSGSPGSSRSPGLPSRGTPGERPLSTLVPRFSALALVSVGLLALTGIYSDWIQTRTLLSLDDPVQRDPRWSRSRSRSGRSRSARSTTSPAAATTDRRFRPRVVVEFGLAIAVLVATGVLASGSPPAQEQPVEIAPVPSSRPDRRRAHRSLNWRRADPGRRGSS